MHTVPTFKLVLIGESGVGKTSLFMRVKDGIFSSEATVGVEFCHAEMFVDDVRVKLSLWDTAGVERFRTLTRNYYRHCHCVLLACSVNDKTSLDNLHRWNQDVDFYCKECVKIILANKSDLAREISAEQLQNFASTFGCKLISLVSAKTGEGMHEMLTEVSRLLIQTHNLQGRASGAAAATAAGGAVANSQQQNGHSGRRPQQNNHTLQLHSDAPPGERRTGCCISN